MLRLADFNDINWPSIHTRLEPVQTPVVRLRFDHDHLHRSLRQRIHRTSLALRAATAGLCCAGSWALTTSRFESSRGLSIGDLPTNYAWFCGKMEEECDEPLDGRGCPIFWTKSHMICRSSVCMHRWNMTIMIVSIHIVDTLKCW